MSVSFIFFIPWPIADVDNTSRWYFSGPSNSLAFLCFSPDKCFSKLSFFYWRRPYDPTCTEPFDVFNSAFVFSTNDTLHFHNFSICSFSHLHLKHASILSTVFRLVILIALYFQRVTLSLIIFIYWTNEAVDWTLFTCAF